MTEDEHERRVEANMNALDKRLMAGTLKQAEYDAEVVRLNRDAERSRPR